jgi:glycerol-3-phosphate dehydrogenase
VEDSFDIVVIGGGITGLGIARLAARNGLRVAVLERGDLAGGTSSASSHMLHGGLRYLEHGRLELVRESLSERRALGHMAPGLARPERFLVPLYRGDRLDPFRLRIGLWLYDRLAARNGTAGHVMVRPSEARAMEPGLAAAGLRGAGLYTDLVMDDGRLAVAVARDAVAHGATVRTYTDVFGARPGPDATTQVLARDTIDGGEHAFPARVVVNATGPWTDAVRLALSRSLNPGAHDPEPILRPSRGIHLVYPRLTNGHGLLIVARADGRVFFAVPFGEHTLVGTTEVEVLSPPPPSAWRPTYEEVRYLRDELRRALPGAAGVPPLALMSGLRPLLRSEDTVGRASREHRVVDDAGFVSVAGGKYTTFRVVARDVLARVGPRLGRAGRPIADPEEPLPPPVAADADVERIAEHAVRHELARRVSDVIRRRSRLWLTPDRGRIAAPRIAAVMAKHLGWSPERTRDEVQRWESELWDEEWLLQKSISDA